MQTHHRNRKRIIYLTPNPTTTPHSPQISSTLPKRKTNELVMERKKRKLFGSHPESAPRGGGSDQSIVLKRNEDSSSSREQPRSYGFFWVLVLRSYGYCYYVNGGSGVPLYLKILSRELERKREWMCYGDLGVGLCMWIEKDIKWDLFLGSFIPSLSSL